MQNIYNNAVEFYQNAQYDKGIERFFQILENDKHNHQVLNFLGMSYYAKQDLDNAMLYLKKAYEANQMQVEYPTNLGILFLSIKDNVQALEWLSRAIEIDSNYIDALVNITDVQIKLGDLTNAQKSIMRALELDPNNIYVNKKAAVLNQLLGNKSQAIGHYNAILKFFPNDLEAILKLAELYAEFGAYNDALELYKKAFEIDPSLLNSLFLKGTMHQIYNKLFPINRFAFYNDTVLVNAIKETLVDLELNDKMVVSLKDSEGVLGMICAKEGATVTFINDEEFFIEKSKLIASQNNLIKSVNFIQKEMPFIDTKDIKEKQDLILSNLYMEQLPSYESLINIYNFKNNFLAEDGKVFPEQIIFNAQLIQSNQLYKKGTASDAGGVDISSLNYYRPIYLNENLQHYDVNVLSKTIELHQFDLYQIPQRQIEKSFNVQVSDDGICHGIAFSTSKYFNGIEIKGDVEQQKQLIYLFDKPVKVEKDIDKTLKFVYSSIAMFFMK